MSRYSYRCGRSRVGGRRRRSPRPLDRQLARVARGLVGDSSDGSGSIACLGRTFLLTGLRHASIIGAHDRTSQTPCTRNDGGGGSRRRPHHPGHGRCEPASEQHTSCRTQGGDWGTVPAAVPVPLDSWFDNDGIDTADARGGDFDGSGYTLPRRGTPRRAAGDRRHRLSLPRPGGGRQEQHRRPRPAHRTAPRAATSPASSSPPAATAPPPARPPSTTRTAPPRPPPSAAPTGTPAAARSPPRTATARTGRRTRTRSSSPPPSCGMRPASARRSRSPCPSPTPPRPNKSSLHIFALSLQPAAEGRALALRDAHSTTRCSTPAPRASRPPSSTRAPSPSSPPTALTLSVDVPGARTVAPARVTRLAPGDRPASASASAAGRAPHPAPPRTARSSHAAAAAGGRRRPARSPSASPTTSRPTPPSPPTRRRTGSRTPSSASSSTGASTRCPPGRRSASSTPSGTGTRCRTRTTRRTPTTARRTASPSPTTTSSRSSRAETFNPRSWVELFRDAGAQYHVLTSKHHEGFALWDTKVSDRNSVKMGPKRDLVKELFDASRRYTPELHRGLYFSMPEWFNPDNPWMGHAPRNPYTLEPVPYTGYTAGKDYVKDYQAPQMLELIHGYDPEILWCDIGGDNDSHRVLAEYFNHAKNRARPVEVTVNNRSGIGTARLHDARVHDVRLRPSPTSGSPAGAWTRSATATTRPRPTTHYMTTEEVVHSPRRHRLQERQLPPRHRPARRRHHPRDHGAPTARDGGVAEGQRRGDLRQHVLVADAAARRGPAVHHPAGQGLLHPLAGSSRAATLTVEAPVPIRSGDKVTMLGHGRPLSWRTTGGKLVDRRTAGRPQRGQARLGVQSSLVGLRNSRT